MLGLMAASMSTMAIITMIAMVGMDLDITTESITQITPLIMLGEDATIMADPITIEIDTTTGTTMGMITAEAIMAAGMEATTKRQSLN